MLLVSRQHPRAEQIISDFHHHYEIMLKDGVVNEILDVDWLATDIGNDGKLDLVLRSGVSFDDLGTPNQQGDNLFPGTIPISNDVGNRPGWITGELLCRRQTLFLPAGILDRCVWQGYGLHQEGLLIGNRLHEDIPAKVAQQNFLRRENRPHSKLPVTTRRLCHPRAHRPLLCTGITHCCLGRLEIIGGYLGNRSHSFAIELLSGRMRL